MPFTARQGNERYGTMECTEKTLSGIHKQT